MDQTEELSTERMLELLQQAEGRLRNKTDSAKDEFALQTPKQKQPAFNFPRLSVGDLVPSHIKTVQHGATVLQAADKEERSSSLHFRKVEDPVMIRQRKVEQKKATAGDRWYNLPKTDLTPELKRDLQILKMRNVLDPHRHYKKENGKMKAPEFSQIGTIIEGPTEYYSARIINKDRKRTFVEEVLAGEQETGRFKKKYGDVQAKKTSGKKDFYKSVLAKRAASYKKR